MTTGKVDATLFRYPLNAIAGGVFLFFLIMVYAASRKAAVLQWFYSLTASITSLTAWMVLVIIMGLTRQVAPSATVTHGGLLSGLGFMQMTVSWPFMLLFLYFLSVLGLVTIRKISCFKWKDVPFILNHAGLFITLLAAILGNGDLQPSADSGSARRTGMAGNRRSRRNAGTAFSHRTEIIYNRRISSEVVDYRQCGRKSVARKES